MGADSSRGRYFACSDRFLASDFSAVDDEWGEEILDRQLHLSTSSYGSMIGAGGVDSKARLLRAVEKEAKLMRTAKNRESPVVY